MRDVPHDYVEIPDGVRARFVKLSIEHMPGKGYPAVSGLRVFGLGSGTAPAQPSGLRVERRKEDRCVAAMSREPVVGATGYNVFLGITPSKLYNCFQVYEANELTIRALNADADAYFAVEAFSANGVSPVTALS